MAATSPSFPSGHATLAAAFYLALLIALGANRPRRALIAAAIVTAAIRGEAPASADSQG